MKSAFNPFSDNKSWDLKDWCVSILCNSPTVLLQDKRLQWGDLKFMNHNIMKKCLDVNLPDGSACTFSKCWTVSIETGDRAMLLFKLWSLHWHILRVKYQYLEKEDNFALEMERASGMQCDESLVLPVDNPGLELKPWDLDLQYCGPKTWYLEYETQCILSQFCA